VGDLYHRAGQADDAQSGRMVMTRDPSFSDDILWRLLEAPR
jgi:hypothetical protein